MDSLASPHREAAGAGKSTWAPWETVARILPKQEQLWMQHHHFNVSVLYPHIQSGIGWRSLAHRLRELLKKRVPWKEIKVSIYLVPTTL